MSGTGALPHNDGHPDSLLAIATCKRVCHGAAGNEGSPPPMDLHETLLIDNEPYEVTRAAEWLDGHLGGAACPPRVVAVLQVALEEVLTNIMLHGYNDIDPHQIEVSLAADADAVTLDIADDGIPFDPTLQSLPDPPSPGPGQPGGLGILFVRKLMDEVTFARDGERNRLTLRKRIVSHTEGEARNP